MINYADDANGMPLGNAPPPEGYPAGEFKNVMPGIYNATNVLVEVTINHGNGTFHMRVNGEALVEVYRGFPAGAALRPWVCAYHTSVSFVRPYL